MRFRLTLAACAALLATWAMSPPAAAADVATEVRDKVQEYLAGTFILPQTTIWRFDDDKPFVDGDKVVCGAVNFQSAQQRYVGFHQFYAILHADQVTLAQIADPVSDVSGKLKQKLKQLCGDG